MSMAGGPAGWRQRKKRRASLATQDDCKDCPLARGQLVPGSGKKAESDAAASTEAPVHAGERHEGVKAGSGREQECKDAAGGEGEEDEEDVPLAALAAQERRSRAGGHAVACEEAHSGGLCATVVASGGEGEEERAAGKSDDTGSGGGPGGYVVYLLRSTSTSRSYVGMTNDLPRRLRQHNGACRQSEGAGESESKGISAHTRERKAFGGTRDNSTQGEHA